LSEIINHSHDQILFINLGPSEGRGERTIAALGQPYNPIDAACLVV
jgi:CRISPR-associated protein Cas2